jgi:hypothetical protein
MKISSVIPSIMLAGQDKNQGRTKWGFPSWGSPWPKRHIVSVFKFMIFYQKKKEKSEARFVQ